MENQEFAAKELTVMVISSGFYGNTNPAIGIAQYFYNRGHKIIFVANFMFEGKLKIYDFQEIIIHKNTRDKTEHPNFWNNFYLKSGVLESKKTPLQKTLIMIPVLMNELIKSSKIIDKTIESIINQYNPNVIIVDAEFVALPSVIKSGCLWISYSSSNPLTMIPDERTPPAFSGLATGDSSEWSRFREEYYRIIKPLCDDVNQWMTEEGLSPLMDNKLHYESPFLNIYNFPTEIDYTDMRPLPSNWAQFDSFVRTEFNHFVLPEHLKNKSGKLIYLSMGSIASINVQMMRRLIQILSQSPHRFIISKGDFADRYELSDNMCGESFLPQTKVIPIVDMVIMHGGNSGLVEAFYFGKPMIIMPLCFDQFDNAQRVVESGLGLRVDPNKCSNKELISSIDTILNDQRLAKRMKQISKRIQNEAKSEKLALLIEEILMQQKKCKINFST